MLTVKANRIPELDIIKAIAIFLVLWGHSIQTGEGIDVLTNPIGKGIYLFHMALFLFVSGYVSLSGIRRTYKDLFKSRMKTLLLPMLSWCFISLILKFAFGIEELPTTIKQVASCYFAFGQYWFIWVVLYSTFYLKLILSINTTYQELFVFLSLIILFLIPHSDKIFALNHFRVFYPFFVLGYISGKHTAISKLARLSSTFQLLVFFVGVIIFIVCYFYSNPTLFIYRIEPMSVFLTPISTIIFKEIFILLAGVSGIILVTLGVIKFKTFLQKNFILIMGSCTFAIYMVQGIIYEVFFKAFPIDYRGFFAYLIISILVLLACLATINLIKCLPYLSKILL